jgi:hypothetical protein
MINDITNRECFDSFVEEMRKVLKSHNSTKGDDWREQPEHILVENLFEEFREFEIKSDPDHELIDIANSAYLLWAKRKYFKGV